jgi:hypothetical protein
MECFIEKQVDLQPGENLRGVVRLTVHNEETFHQSFDGINIVVAGVEYMLLGNDEDDATRMMIVPTAKVIKLKSFMDLSSQNTKKGAHEIPFEIELPTVQEHRRYYRNQSSSFSLPLSLSPGLKPLESSESSVSDSEMTDLSPISTVSSRKSYYVSSDDEPPSRQLQEVIFEQGYDEMMSGPQKTVIYSVKAVLHRRKDIPLSVDTDIKCHARCMETLAL